MAFLQGCIDKIESWMAERERSGAAADPRRRTPQRVLKLPKFVEFHMADSAEGCDEIFWEDPLNFTPRRGRNGWIDSWGIYPHDRRGFRKVDGERISQRTAVTGMIYCDDEQLPLPEIQFIDALITKKVSQLKQVDLGDLPQRDFTLYISLPFIEAPYDPRADRYWRRVKVSGGLPLFVLADKIITPLWGWVRNLHAHAFHDFKDGAVFGPKGCNAVDMEHLDKSGYKYIPEEEYCIAHILRTPGDVMGYHYDFGDNWFVDIKLEEIASKDESNGAVAVLDGAGGILPDGELIGTFAWADRLRQAARSPTAKRKAVSTLFEATNLTQAGKRPPANPDAFDLDAFDLEGTRRAVRDALDSKASLPYASKKFVSPIGAPTHETMLSDEAVKLRLGMSLKDMKKGTALAQVPVSDRTFLEEGVSVGRKDNPGNTACANCGSPSDLKACAACGQRYYCSKACQKAHWKDRHKTECDRSARRK